MVLVVGPWPWPMVHGVPLAADSGRLTTDRRILFFLTYLSGRQTSYHIERADSGRLTTDRRILFFLTYLSGRQTSYHTLLLLSRDTIEYYNPLWIQTHNDCRYIFCNEVVVGGEHPRHRQQQQRRRRRGVIISLRDGGGSGRCQCQQHGGCDRRRHK
jgi:hypothetical protein